MTTACVLKLGVPRSARQPKWMFSGEGSRERVFGTNHIRHFRPLAFFFPQELAGTFYNATANQLCVFGI